ncbi:hypothetical protein [Shewanella mesophila]|uniref:hypothetical protein n=1 Tax=Shewanella mesophila TaxID=2864208 RepID=UPI0021ACAA9A|nr:hypothetical protein [Shewanella mesophila]
MSNKSINKRLTLTFALMISTVTTAAWSQGVTLINSDGDAMAGMVVYLNGASSQQSNDNAIREPIEIHQNNKQFTPYITVIQKGYELQFVNDDDITHHIYSASGPKRFSFKLRKDNAQQAMLFDQVGHISMGCNIHDWMSGHLLVVDTPYFGVTDANGFIDFDVVPPGQYQVVIWHPQLLSQDNIVTYESQWPLTQTLTIKIDAPMAEIPSQQSLDDFEFLEGY